MAALTALLGLAVGCSGFTAKIGRRFGGKVPFEVEIDGSLNRDFPLAVDFVVVYDKDLMAELEKLSAADWFAQRAQYRLDNEPERLEVSAWEWVPPCSGCPQPDPQVVSYRLGAQGAALFSNYFNPGVHRIVIEPLEAFTLKLGETEATLGAAGGDASRADRKRAKRQAKKEKRKAKQAKRPKKASDEGGRRR